MTRHQIVQQLKQKDASRLRRKLRWIHNQGYSFQYLSSLTDVPEQTIINFCYGHTKTTRNEKLKKWIDYLYDDIKNGCSPSHPNDDHVNNNHKPPSERSRRKPLEYYKYPYADNLLSKKDASDYASAIQTILLYGTSYLWIADQIGSDPAIIHKLHTRTYYDAVLPCFASLPLLLHDIERGSLLPSVSTHRPRLDPRIFAKCHDHVKYLLSVFSKPELCNRLGCSYNTLYYFLIGRTEGFAYVMQVEKLYREVKEQRVQCNVFRISA